MDYIHVGCIKKLLFSSCIYFSSIFADNHETNVIGKVLSSVESIPLQGANVIFVNGDDQYGATTDASGTYIISDIIPGNYDVTISFIGYDDFKEDILIEAGKKYNIDAHYSHLELNDKNFEFKIKELLSKRDLGGLNITIPFKTTVIPYLDQLSREAEQTKSVNTIYLKNEKVIGHNTYIEGFKNAIQNINFNFKNKK